MIYVDPQSVRSYGIGAEEIFNSIRTDLTSLVQDVVDVNYSGENAVQFKTDCGALAADFATALNSDLRAIAEAVRASTSNITGALGGPPVNIEFNGGTISVPPVPAGDGTYSADPAGLEGLKGTVTSRFGSINEHFGTHLSRLTATAWTGGAKDQAVQAVTSFTNAARGKVDDESASLTNFIEKQLESLRAADK